VQGHIVFGIFFGIFQQSDHQWHCDFDGAVIVWHPRTGVAIHDTSVLMPASTPVAWFDSG
jgi:hypothetical protein